MNKWDVVLLSFPFTDLQSSKVRPAIVISPNSFHRVNPDALFMLVTSNLDRQSPHDFIISESHPEFANTGLRKESAVRVCKIMFLNKSMVIKTIGKLDSQSQASFRISR